jgi:hypothetical protein
MKAILTLLSLLIVTISIKAQNTLTVNGAYPSTNGHYSNIQSALAAANAGDIILVEGASQSYGSIWIDKPLTIIGTGHHPQRQLPHPTKFDTITVATDVKNVKLYGLDFYTFNKVKNKHQDNIDELSIEYCLVRDTIYHTQKCDKWVLRNNIFTKKSAFLSDGKPNKKGLLISNNFFYESQIKNIGTMTACVISNNIFSGRQDTLARPVFKNLQKARVQNNLFYYTNPTTDDVKLCLYNRNLLWQCSDCTVNSGGQNLSPEGTITSQEPKFVNYTGGDFDPNFDLKQDFHLKPNSPGTKSGTDGNDIGVFTEDYIFSMTGEPVMIPFVREIVINSGTTQVAPSTTTINVNFKAGGALPK